MLIVFEADDPINRQRETTYEDIFSLKFGDVVSTEDGSDIVSAEDGKDIISTEGGGGGLLASQKGTRVITCAWNCYGVNSWDRAQELRDKLFYQSYHDYLSQYDIYLIPDMRACIRAPEERQGSWWERVDFNAEFNNGIIRQEEIGYIESADIEVNNAIKSQKINITE